MHRVIIAAQRLFTCMGLFSFGGKLDSNNAMCSVATAVIGRVSVLRDKGVKASASPATSSACAPNDSRFHAVYAFYLISTHIKEDIPP